MEYLLTVKAIVRNSSLGLPKGHVAGYEQFGLSLDGSKPSAPSVKGKFDISDDGTSMTVKGTSVEFVFDRAEGSVVSYKVNGTEYIDKGFGFRPNFWRGPTDNDYGNRLPARSEGWKKASKEFNVTSLSGRVKGGSAIVKAVYSQMDRDFTVTYTIRADGAMRVSSTLDAVQAASGKNQPTLPRIGLRLRLPVSMHNVSYYGRGEGENYWDRKTGSLLGVYKSTAEQMYFPYIRPQENGHRTDVRWATFTDDSGKGLAVLADGSFEFNALRNSVEDFDSAESGRPVQTNYYNNQDVDVTNGRRQTHINDIKPRDYVEICIDKVMMGIGGDNSWGAPINPRYIIDETVVNSYSFTIVPVDGNTEEAVNLKY